MNPRICARNLALFALAFTSLSLLGCNSSSSAAQGTTSKISGPLTMLPDYQARAPRTCSSVTSPPSTSQAVVMVQCQMDQLSPIGLALVQNITVDMGKSRPFDYGIDSGLPGVDLTSTVYPIRGGYTAYFCRLINNMSPAGQSCIKSVVPTAMGACWKTSFGDYKCALQGLAPKMEQGMPAPQTF